MGSAQTVASAVSTLGAILALLTGTARGDETISPPDVSAIRLDGSAVQLDGIIDEAIWQQAAPITGLASFDPADGKPPASQLRAWVFYDDHALYVAARITTRAHQLRGRLSAREQWDNDDLFQVAIDPFLDRRTGYGFMVNPYGVQLDVTIEDDDWDSAWDGVWDSATQHDDSGFSVEMRIPFRTLRFSAAPTQRWGISLGVFSGVQQQYDKWPAMKRELGTAVAQFGTLSGLRGLQRSHNVELIPALTAGYGGSDLGTGFAWDAPRLARAREPGILDPGLDVAWAVSSATSLNATVNPDFSQVEADAEQLKYNLRFPLVLDEKRPFFLEGLSVFATPVPLLYTRSIIDPLAGAKLSSRIGGWSLGLLTLWDQLPLSSQLVETRRSSGFEDLTAQDALDTIGRVARDLGGGSRIGLWFADKQLYDRRTGALGARNDVVSADASLVLGDIYTIRAQGGGSYVDAPGRDFAGGFYFLDARRRSAALLLALRTEYYAETFRAETSPIARVGVAPSSAEARYHHAIDSEAVPFVEAGVVGASVHDTASGTLLDWSIRPSAAVHLGGSSDLSVFYSRGQETFVRAFAGLDRFGAELTAYPWRTLSLVARLEGGDQLNYDTDDLFLGRSVVADLRANIIPRHDLELGLGYANNVTWRPEGTRAADIHIYYLKLALSFTTRLAIRVIAQLDDSDDVLRTSALVSYVVYPGTEAYLGYQDDEGGITAGSPHAVDRRVFFKLSYRWQL